MPDFKNVSLNEMLDLLATEVNNLLSRYEFVYLLVPAVTLIFSIYYLIRGIYGRQKRNMENGIFIIYCALSGLISGVALLTAHFGTGSVIMTLVEIIAYIAFVSLPAIFCLHTHTQISYKNHDYRTHPVFYDSGHFGGLVYLPLFYSRSHVECMAVPGSATRGIRGDRVHPILDRHGGLQLFALFQRILSNAAPHEKFDAPFDMGAVGDDHRRVARFFREYALCIFVFPARAHPDHEPVLCGVFPCKRRQCHRHFPRICLCESEYGGAHIEQEGPYPRMEQDAGQQHIFPRASRVSGFVRKLSKEAA
jgi:hypothetical protein